MSEPNKSRPSNILPWSLLVVAVLAIIGASALALLLIPQLSLNATIRGAWITIFAFVGIQLGLRLSVWLKGRGNRA